MDHQNPRKILFHYMEAFNSYCGHREGDVKSVRIPIIQDDQDQSVGEVSTSPIVEFPDEEDERLGECSDYAIQTVEEDEENFGEVKTKAYPDNLEEKDFEEVTTIQLPKIPCEEDKCRKKINTISRPEIPDDANLIHEQVKTSPFSEIQDEGHVAEIHTIMSSPELQNELKLGELENAGEVTTIPQPEFADEEMPPFLVQ